MKLLLISILWAIVSCGQIGPQIQTVEVSNVPYVGMGIDPAFFKEVMAFEVEWGRHVTNTDIFFVERLKEPNLGEAWNANKETYQKIIMVDRQKWEQNPSKNFREPLIFHELGHAVLGLEHIDILDSDGCPKSVMHKTITPPDCWENNRRSYLDALFKKR